MEAEEKYALSSEEKEKVLDVFRANPKSSIKAIVEKVFPNQDLDGRSKQGKAITGYLSTLSIRPKTTKYQKMKFSLTEHQQDFLRNNAEYMELKEMVAALFPGKERIPTSIEYRKCREYVIEIVKPARKMVEGATPFFEEGYRPPKTTLQVLQYVNKYTTENLDQKSINASQKEGAEALRSFLHAPRIAQMIDAYELPEDKEMFFAEFVRACYNKPDLSSDDVNLYVNLCDDYVTFKNLTKIQQSISRRLNEIIEDPDGKVSIGLTESLDKVSRNAKECLDRQNRYIAVLSGKRSDKMKNKPGNERSFMSFVEFWREEKNRDRIKALEQRRRELIGDCVVKLDSMDSVYAEIWGGLPESLFKE